MIVCVSVSSKETINSTFYASYEHTFLTEVLKLKKKELTFIIGIVVFALLLWGGMYLTRRGNYGSIRITVNGEEYGTYSLGKDQVIKINGTNKKRRGQNDRSRLPGPPLYETESS